MAEASRERRSHGLVEAANRYAALVRWLSVAVVVLSVVIVHRQLPLARLMQPLADWVADLGVLGPLVFGGVYTLAVVLLVPAWPMTVLAGAVFGLPMALVTVSLASTTGAALAFLVARYLARGAVARQLARDSRFEAVDEAISANGWKIVALLRLSPAVPFNVQNYLYGLTGIPFWTYVLTSWVAMLPGTLLYVYLGYAGRAGLEAASGRARSREEWALLAVGLVATAAVTVYITRLGRRAMRRHHELARSAEPTARAAGEPAPTERWPWGATAAALGALVSLALACAAALHPQTLERLFAGLLGPPPAALREAYRAQPRGPRFDHSAFDELLKTYVDDAGWVDYRGLQADSEKLDSYLGALSSAPFEAMGRSEKLALLLNAYNACTLRLVLDYYPIASIQAIPPAQRWDDKRWRIGGRTWSLAELEHAELRAKFREPRVHFALVCASAGCPPLRREAYAADRIDQQLDDQTRYVHTHDRWFRYDHEVQAVWLTRLYQWYRRDFEQVAGSVLDFAARYRLDLAQALASGQKPARRWLKYDWSLNSKEPLR